MPIFRYTTKKLLISPSTWVILIISVLILGLSWSLPFIFVNAQYPGDIVWTKDLVLSLFLNSWKLFTFSTFISFALFIFIGVKSTQIFRDEIDDGTLLILVSKPISRNRIWSEKWLSFQFTLILYVFSTILLSGLVFLLPKVGNGTVYLTFLPYMGILFGITLLFDLIISSIILLFSLVLNSKATIAISIGFAALISIFSQTLELLVEISPDYFAVSQSVAVYHDLEKKLESSDTTWIEEQLQKDSNVYQTEIDTILKKVYQTNITTVVYPENYNPIAEQRVLNDIKKGDTNGYTLEEVILITHIVNVSDIFRQWKEQSYSELMTSIQVGQDQRPHGSAQLGANGVNYSFFDVYQGINKNFSQTELDNINTKIFQKRMLRYFNIFYHFYYLWTGSWGDNSSLYVSSGNYESQNDPYVVGFNKNNNSQYQVDLNSGNNKILNFPVLLAVYLIIGITLLGTSWYIFNTRDFT